MVMIDKSNPNVLSFIRTPPHGSKPVVVMMNMTSSPQSCTVDLSETGLQTGRLHTLLSTTMMPGVASLGSIQLPPYAVWIVGVY